MPAPIGNKFAVGNSGKPKKFATPEELQENIEAYFSKCDENYEEVIEAVGVIKILRPIPYTVEGLGIALGVDRHTLLDYEKEKGYEDYYHIVKEAKRKIFNNWVTGAIMGKHNANFTKFVMINNTDYRDKIETDITTKGEKLEAPVISISLADRIKQLSGGEDES